MEKLIPKLRFPEFDGEWEEQMLNSLCTFFSGGTPSSTNKSFFNGIIPFIKSGEISSEITEQFLTEEGLANSSAKIVNKGDILYALYGATSGQVAISKINGAINQAVLCIRSKNLNNIFLKEILLFKKKDIVGKYIQGGQGNLSASIIKKLTFNFPSLQEQTKIANFLGKVDKQIEILSTKKEKLEAYKKGVMQRVFSQELRFKKDDGTNYPDWEEKKLGEIGEFKNGLNKDKSQFGFGIPFINLSDIFDKKSVQYQSLSLVNASQRECEQYSLKKGDVLFVRSSVKKTGVGLTIVIEEDLENTVYSGFIIRFREFHNLLSLSFKKYCFYNKNFRNSLLEKSTSSANTNINQDSLSKLEIQIPHLEEQTKIANFLSAIDSQIEQVDQQINKSKAFKKGLLQQLFV